MTAHAFLPPSGADAWVHCALWPTMNAQYPDAGSEDSEEGTAAHWVVSERTWGVVHKEGDRAPNGVVVTREMLLGADLWIQAIRPLLGQELHVEETLPASRYAPENWGTPDLWTFNPAIRRLDVADYKFGHGYVPATTWQLVDYTMLALERLDLPTDLDIDVHLHIVQPRCYDAEPHRVHVTRASHMRAQFNRLTNAAGETRKPEPLARTGAHCKHCPGRHACVALQRDGFSSMDEAFRTTPQDLPPAALAVELALVERALERLSARATGLREQAMSCARAGRLPGWVIERGRGTHRWVGDPVHVIEMGRTFGIPLSKTEVAVTPGQAIAAGLPEAIVAAISHTTPGPEKLVPAPDVAGIFGVDIAVNKP